MIPKIIHQTWKNEVIPAAFAEWSRGWREKNADWQWVLWTDRMLLDLCAEHYPELLPVFASYDQGIMRADVGRYLVLHRFGGIYADLDTECIGPLEQIHREDRVVVCQEPPGHWSDQIPFRCHPFLLFNGVMASPPGHDFWRTIFDLLPLTRPATDILDATGPSLVTGAYLNYGAQKDIRVEDCRLFCGTDRDGVEFAASTPPHLAPIARHHWAATWISRPPRPDLASSARKTFYEARHRLTRGPFLSVDEARKQVNPAALAHPLPTGRRITILVPIRDAVPHLRPFFDLLRSLDAPKRDLKLVFCEGDSKDATWARLNEIATSHRAEFRDIILTRRDIGVAYERANRSERSLQRRWRSGLAAVRNHLIDTGLDESDDWALWIDADVCRFPAGIIDRLLDAKARIVAPHCVTHPGGPTFDLNSFVARRIHPDFRYYKYLRDGLFHAPRPPFYGRMHMDGLRHSKRVALDGVGGSMLLVDASLHRGGLRFPELPYRHHIETAGFGLMARDLGVGAVGLPQVEIQHVPW
jgi:GT2 family glycosyltransferase